MVGLLLTPPTGASLANIRRKTPNSVTFGEAACNRFYNQKAEFLLSSLATDSLGALGGLVARQIDAETAPSLLVRIRDNADADAWARFAGVYSPIVYNFCRVKGFQAQDAADITQEVLVRVARAIRAFEYDPERGLFRDWLARIVQNEANRFRSKLKPASSLDDVPAFSTSGTDWSEHFQRHVMQVALDRCREKFTDETWTIFEKSWVQEQPLKEVAEDCGVGLDKVYVARSRVLKHLRYEVQVLTADSP